MSIRERIITVLTATLFLVFCQSLTTVYFHSIFGWGGIATGWLMVFIFVTNLIFQHVWAYRSEKKSQEKSSSASKT